MPTPTIDFGTGLNTPSGDRSSEAISKLLARIAIVGGAETPGIATFRLGQQDGSYSYYSMSDFVRDKNRMSSIRYRDEAANSNYAQVLQIEGGIGGYDKDGYINSYPAGQTWYRFAFTGYWSQLGTYTFAYPKGMTLSPSLIIADSYVFGPEYDINTTGPNNAGRKVTVLRNSINAGDVLFTGIPNGKTATTMGFRPTLTFDGDKRPDLLVTDEVVASYRALNSKIFRSMDARKINNDISPRTVNNVQSYFGMSLPVMVDLCNETGEDLWLNHWVYQNDESVRADYDYIVAKLRPDVGVHIEYSNENWNTAFAQAAETMYLGMEAGLVNATNSAEAVPLAKPLIRLDGKFTSQPPIPTQNFSTGDMVAGNRYGSGNTVWKALQNITANDVNATLPGATNAYWQVVYTHSQGVTAALRYTSRRTAQIAAIAKAAFVAGGRSVAKLYPVYAWQAVASFNACKVAFDFDDNYKVFKRYATAPYWGGFMGNYNGQHFGTWTASQKALYLTDTAACLDYFFANVNQDIDDTLGRQESRKKELAEYVASKGLPENAIQLCAYEMHNHTQFIPQVGWSDSSKANAMQGGMNSDPRFGAATAYFISEYRRRIGGDAVWYGRCGLPSPWNSQVNELDRTSVVMAAVMANA